MSDFDPTPDPIDEAYVRAEALLADEAARAARRERILAAVGREPAVAAPAPAPPRRRAPVWRRGGWLAAACVAGLSLVIVGQVYEPTPRRPLPPASPTLPAPPVLPAPAAGPVAPTAAGPAHEAPTSAAAVPPGPIAKPASVPVAVSAYASKASPAPEVAGNLRGAAQAPPPTPAPPPPPPAAAPVLAQAPRAFPAEPPQSVVVTAERRASERAADAADSRDTVSEVVIAQAAPSRKSARSQSFATIAPQGRLSSFAARTFDQATRLREAAEAGQTAEVESLLDQGAPVDAPDAEGNTALIKSVQADHPAAAAALSRHGASLDHKNHAGESARDIAAAKEDAALNEALGLGP
jgi:hypothetical protein